MKATPQDIYAGDAAWIEWFDQCCVTKCAPENQRKLANEIRSAMFAQVVRFGFPASLVDGEDPIRFFDAYFLAHGSQDARKPLKSYFSHRIAEECLRLKDFVCGTLFSSRHGRVHDIVREWIADLKGWRPHSLVGADGLRTVSWEGAARKDDVRENCGVLTTRPGARLDREVYRGFVQEMLASISLKIKLEKSAVAFLLYAMAQGVPVSSPEVLARLKVRKSRAHQLKEMLMKQVEQYLKEREVDATDLAFARIMIAETDRMSGEEA